MIPFLTIYLKTRFSFFVTAIFISFIFVFLGFFAAYFQQEFFLSLSQPEFMGYAKTPLPWMIVGKICLLLAQAVGCFILAQALQSLLRWLCAKEGNWFENALSHKLYEKALEKKSSPPDPHTTPQACAALFASDLSAARTLFDDALATFFVSFVPICAAPFILHFNLDLPVGNIINGLFIYAVICFALAKRQSCFFMRAKDRAQIRITQAHHWIKNHRAAYVLGCLPFLEKRMLEARVSETENRLHQVSNGGFLNGLSHTAPVFMQVLGLVELHHAHLPLNSANIFFVVWILGVFVLRPMRSVPWMLVVGVDAFTSIHRLSKVLGKSNGLNEKAKTPILHQPQSHMSFGALTPTPLGIQVNNLNIRIQGRAILSGVNFSVDPGKTLGVIGKVGAGKSTLLKALIQELPVHSGEIQVHSPQGLCRPAQAGDFSYVPQEPFLWEGLIAQNIALDKLCFRTNRSLFFERINRSLNASQMFTDLSRRFENPEYVRIGAGGMGLSGGQKQRLSVARAFFFGRPLLLLDDCLSAVDIETEEILIHSLLKTPDWNGVTQIIVTQRPSILKYCHKVMLLHNGTVGAFGSWEQLKEHELVQDILEVVV